jgi:dTDP-4-dehydrorhamnose 3,5-epimerase
MRVIETQIPDVKVLIPKTFADERGFFQETWNARVFAEHGLDLTFVQDNHSNSAKGVLRGLHYQIRYPQGKLMRVVRGCAFDVAVDLRRSSPTFRRWVGVEISAQNKQMLWIPPGFAHGFLALEDDTELLYKCTDYYAPEDERSLLWNDMNLAIQWPLPNGTAPRLSAKDMNGTSLAAAETFE